MHLFNPAQSLRQDFLSSRAARSWFLLLALALLSSILVGVAFYQLTVKSFKLNKTEEAATALRLTEALVSSYTEIRSATISGEAPVPAEFRAQAIERFNATRDSSHQLSMDWVGIPGREIATAPRDVETAATLLRAAAERQDQTQSTWLRIGGEVMFRTIAPSLAGRQACVSCHNAYLTDQPPWQLGDVMGAFIIDVPAGGFLAEARRYSVIVAGSLFFVFAVISAAIFYLQHRRQVAESMASAIAEGARLDSEARHLAEAANRAKSRFLALMSHELRTPLNAILGFSEIIACQTLGKVEPRYIEYAEDIHSSGQHLLTLISDILELAKAESGRLRVMEETITLAEIIDPCIRLVSPRAKQKRLALSVSQPTRVDLVVDPTKLRQTILNLLSNAVKYTPDGGRISVVALLQEDGGLTIQVADTGIGIAPEDIPLALKPFERLKAAEQIEGTGLGLPLARMLAELHDGALELTSMPGCGTQVTIYLPPHRVLSIAMPAMPCTARTSVAPGP